MAYTDPPRHMRARQDTSKHIKTHQDTCGTTSNKLAVEGCNGLLRIWRKAVNDSNCDMPLKTADSHLWYAHAATSYNQGVNSRHIKTHQDTS